MGPQLQLAGIEADARPTNQRLGPLSIGRVVNRDEPCAKLRLVNLELFPSPLISSLRLSHARLHGLDAVAAGQRLPRTGAKSLECDVCVDEERVGTTGHGASQVNGAFEPIGFEKVAEVVDRRIQQAGRTPCGEFALSQSLGDDGHERLREQRRGRRIPVAPPVA